MIRSLPRHLWIVAAILLFPIAAAVMFAAPINTDAAYILVAARRLLAGDRLYVDLIETNPPLAFWMMMPAAAIGSWLGIPDERLSALFACAVLAGSGWLAVRVLRLEPIGSGVLRVAMLGAFTAALMVIFPEQVSQREMLGAMLILPYTLLAARTINGVACPRALRIACGLAAGIGFAIKPFFLLAWIAVEAVIVFRAGVTSALRPDSIAIAATQAAYGVAVLALTPQYLSRIVPMAAELYGAYGRSRRATMSAIDVRSFTVAGAVSLLAPRWLATTHEAAAFAQVFGAASLGWMVCFLVQGKGWKYHVLPAVAYVAVAGAATIVLAIAAVRTAGHDSIALRARRWLLTVLLIAAAFPGAWYAQKKVHEMVTLLRRPYGDDLKAMVRLATSRAIGEPIYVMSTNVWPSFPMVNLSGATWPYHYHFLWPIPAWYAARQGSPAYRPPDAQGAREREFFETVISDLAQTPPQLLFVEHGPSLQAMDGREFDFVQYFSASPEFRAFLSRYERLGFIAFWDVYQLR